MDTNAQGMEFEYEAQWSSDGPVVQFDTLFQNLVSVFDEKQRALLRVDIEAVIGLYNSLPDFRHMRILRSPDRAKLWCDCGNFTVAAGMDVRIATALLNLLAELPKVFKDLERLTDALLVAYGNPKPFEVGPYRNSHDAMLSLMSEAMRLDMMVRALMTVGVACDHPLISAIVECRDALMVALLRDSPLR